MGKRIAQKTQEWYSQVQQLPACNSYWVSQCWAGEFSCSSRPISIENWLDMVRTKKARMTDQSWLVSSSPVKPAWTYACLLFVSFHHEEWVGRGDKRCDIHLRSENAEDIDGGHDYQRKSVRRKLANVVKQRQRTNFRRNKIREAWMVLKGCCLHR